MARRKGRGKARDQADSRTPAITPLWIAFAMAVASALWAAFLWQQLFVARSGGEAFCALGGDGCTALWDGAFASAVHEWSGLPVAAWGVVWSAAAAALTALTANRASRGEAVEPMWSGTAALALGGALAVVGLAIASLSAGEFCSNCAITYALVAAFAGAVVVASAPLRPQRLGPGLGAALGGLAAAFALAIFPGLQTPKAGAKLGAQALLESRAASPTSGDLVDDLGNMIGRLSTRQKQFLADARARYIDAASVGTWQPRALVGAANAPLRLTTFTDSGCGHCANFHRGLEPMLESLPAGRMSVEQRMFPLDKSCNPKVGAGGRDHLCLAARVRICLEGDPRALELSGWLHDEALPLNAQTIYRVAERLRPRAELDACLTAEDTYKKLASDLALAERAGVQGTPFLLLNGKPVPTFIPFLYALAVVEGDVNHPIFEGLPAPRDDPGHAH